MKPIASSAIFTRLAQRERRNVYPVLLEVAPLVILNQKGISRSKAGTLTIENISPEEWPVRNVISISFEEMAIFLRENVSSVIKNLKY
jgi:hypothetical protein